MQWKQWAIGVILVVVAGGTVACDDAVVGECSGGLMGQIASYLVEVRYWEDGVVKQGGGFTVVAKQNGQVQNSRTTDAGGFTMVYVMHAGPTEICASKTGFYKQCKSFDAVLGQVTLVHFLWKIKQLVTDIPITEFTGE